MKTHITRLCRDSDFHLDTGLDIDDDLLDHLGRGVQTVRFVSAKLHLRSPKRQLPTQLAPRARGGEYELDQALVNPHLVTIPGLRTLTARSLTGGDLEDFCGEADGALDAEGLGLGAFNQVSGDYCACQCTVLLLELSED